MDRHFLHSLFHPQSLAVVGASDRYGSTGRSVFGHLLASAAAPLIVPVNNKHKTVGGMKAFETLADAAKEHQTDTAVVVLAADKLPGIVREAAKCGVGHIVFINELDLPPPSVRTKLDRAAEYARKAGIRLLAVPVSGLQGLYRPEPDTPACVYIGQSAAIADCMQTYAEGRGIVFSRFLTLNPQHYPVSTGQIIDYTAFESSASALLVHIGTLDNAQELVSALSAAARRKPVVVLVTLPEHQEALFAHALRRKRIPAVSGLSEFLTAAKLIHSGIAGRGKRTAIISNSPQIATLALKTLPQAGLEAAQPSTAAVRAAARVLAQKPVGGNPLYLPADAAAPVFQAVAEQYLQDEHTDAVCLIYAGSNPADSYRTAQMTAQLQKSYRKPLLLVWLGSANTAEVRQLFGCRRNLHFRQSEHALHALSQLDRYRQHQRQKHCLSAFHDYRAAAQAAAQLRKQLRSILSVAVLPLPATKANLASLLAALQTHNQTTLKKTPAAQMYLTWDKQEDFGQVLTLSDGTHRLALLPPLTPETAAEALRSLDLPDMIWHGWLLDTVEILSRLPEIHHLSLALCHDVKHGISCTEAKINLQDPESFTVSDRQQLNLFAPYPYAAEETVPLKGGKTAFLRPVRAEDAGLIRRLAAEQSEQSRHLRFMTRLSELPPSLLSRLSCPDYQREFALILHDDDCQPLAHAAYTADADGTACEFGISVADSLHGQGIGVILMERLIRHARNRGYRRIRAEILADNHPMQKLALKLGFTLSQNPHDRALVNAVLDLEQAA